MSRIVQVGASISALTAVATLLVLMLLPFAFEGDFAPVLLSAIWFGLLVNLTILWCSVLAYRGRAGVAWIILPLAVLQMLAMPMVVGLGVFLMAALPGGLNLVGAVLMLVGARRPRPQSMEPPVAAA